jgi:hypothetical protein
MAKFFMRKLLLIPILLLCLAACDQDGSTGDVDVSGRWTSIIAIQSCTPDSVCSSVGFQTGQSAVAIMNLDQNGNTVEGTYTYEGAGMNAQVEGRVAGNELTLDGQLQHLLGRITVHLVGTVSDNQINAQVPHDVSLIDGRSGTITGAGNFVR